MNFISVLSAMDTRLRFLFAIVGDVGGETDSEEGVQGEEARTEVVVEAYARKEELESGGGRCRVVVSVRRPGR